MIISRCFRRLISFSLAFTLLFQTFSPAIIYAEEATQSADIQTETVTPEPTPEPTSGSNPVVPLWIQVDDNTITTSENVGEGIDYRFRDTDLIVRFTKLGEPGKLTIREVKLTPEQMAATGALSDTAYDITSDMENGTFLYDLTLPLPQNEPNAKVEFANNADSLNQSQTISQPEEKTENTITIRGLDHFTIFFVTSGDDRATDGTWCDDPGAVCTFGGEESLKTVDGNYLNISSVTGIPGWSASYFDSQYVQFNFNHPELTGVSIANAKLKLVYKTNSIDGGYDSDAKLVISDDGNFDGPEGYEVITVKPTAATITDQPFLVQLPSQYQDSTKLTNLKIRFYLYGVADDGFVTTSFDQVVLLVNYSPPTSTFDTIDSPTNNNSPTITGTATANGDATVKKVEYRADAGLWMPALASDGIFNLASELFKFSLSALTEGNHVFETKVTDSLDTIQTEMVSLNLAVDTTAPDITVPTDITSEATSSLGAIVTYTSPTATDIQDGSDAVSCDKNSGNTFPLGLTTVHCSSTDTAGNTANKNFNVTVQDTTKPTKPTATPAAGDYTSDQSVTPKTSTSGGIGGSGVSDGRSDGLAGQTPVCNDTKPGSAPTLLSAFGGVNNVTLKWTEAADPLTYYLITYGIKPGAQTYGNPNISGQGTTSYTVSGLSGGITYYFQVRAGNGCAPGDFSNEISAATLGPVIPIETPAEGFASGVKGISIDLTPTPTPSILGETNQNNSPWWFIVLLIATGGFGVWLFFRRQ